MGTGGCGHPIVGRGDRRYCSAACRQRAYRQRKAATMRARVERTLEKLSELERTLNSSVFLRPYLPTVRSAIDMIATLEKSD
jgi:hypothetical protein